MLLCLDDVMTMINGDEVVMTCFVHYYKTMRRASSGSYSLEAITLHVLVFVIHCCMINRHFVYFMFSIQLTRQRRKIFGPFRRCFD